MLSVREAEVRYGDFVAVRGVSMEIAAGEFVALVGANAQGKSTLLKSIAGVLRLTAGHMTFNDEDLTPLHTDARLHRGIVLVPEGRHIFPYLTVEENLRLGAWAKHLRGRMRERLDAVYDLMPRLRQRASQYGGSMSGGEQQILAIGRALMSEPKLLMLDEPSLGLSPLWVETIYNVIRRIAGAGTAILLVEQNVSLALKLARRAVVLAEGRCIKEGLAADFLHDDEVRRAYMGL